MILSGVVLWGTSAAATDPTFTRFSLETEMVHVPAGEFVMGADQGSAASRPAHVVYLDAYYIDTYEVTNARYKKCELSGACRSIERFEEISGPMQPIVGVKWEDAETFCRWEGKRLPTEAEWEKAARGPNGRVYPWGDMLSCERSNYGNGGPGVNGKARHPCPENEGRPVNVGSYMGDVSVYGAYDMGGNVWEYVADYYDANYYKRSPVRNPEGPMTGLSHVIRGGAWHISGSRMLSSSRIKRRLTSNGPANSFDGFRCARFDR